MESNRNKKVKSLRATGRKSVKNEIISLLDTHMVRCEKIPPPLNMARIRRESRRWIQTGAVSNQGFTLSNGHDQFLTVITVAGAAAPYVDSWRIRRIKIWCVSQDNFSTSVTLTPTGADSSNMNNDRESIYTCTSRSVGEPASMCIVPSRVKPLGGWHFTTVTGVASVLFQININTNGGSSENRTTMEIDFDVIDNLAGLPLGYSTTTGPPI
jgi:hypothetical protein